MSVLIRRAEPADFDAIARLSVAAYRADGQLDAAADYAAVLADVPARAEAGELLVAVDEITGEVLGSVLFVLPGTPYAELSGPGEAEFRMLAVDPAAQGRGVGGALVRACLTRARDLGCRRVVICTRSVAAAAHRLYARFGFVRTPERDWSPRPGVDLHALHLDLAGARCPVPGPA
ncbi:GNAT family N-acetyltransferase [Micromonospora sp. HM5-17]|jgi:ribosomal protein S18 acetylase RimI-like enzyme|uniref:GNAT family N-acetyltransferase n=1 Tax=Micromonospora sp. HM5-17 TaxID=2487710 RepID=UPI000F471EED|nr:GNAT family N-acetyltransferase [Micromonospora sp. HM5-17]ROT32249.1 GNAT family N-acetyltransferase [Micromonospora sp. HM5-17]